MTKFSIMLLSVMVFIVALIPHIIYFFAWIIGKCFGGHVQYAPFGWCALFLAVLVLCFYYYGNTCGRWKMDVEPVELGFETLPASFDGYKIVHISDFHLASFIGHEDKLQRIVDEINSTDADLVCFTGDLVSFTASEIAPFAKALSGIKAKDGVVSVLGNHDFDPYDRTITESRRDSLVQWLIEEQRGLGWRLLNNENMMIKRGADSIFIVGVMNESSAANGISPVKRGDLKAAMNGANGFCVLLSHDPTHWRAEVAGKSDIPLTLSGHTHAAQLKLFGWTPASWTFRDVEGLYADGDQYLYINTGLGCTLPMRIGVPQEITVITLRKLQ